MRIAVNKRWKHLVVVCVVLAAVLYGLWSSGKYVMAFKTEKRAHIFPTTVVAQGWDSAEKALAQDVAADAPLPSFTRENSAFIYREGTPQEPEPAESPEPEVEVPEAPVGATSTDPIPEDTSTSTDPIPEEMATSSEPVEETEFPGESATSSEETLMEPVATSTESEEEPFASSTARGTSSIGHLFAFFGGVRDVVAPPVFAQEEGESSTAPTLQSYGEIAECTIAGTECHTIEFGGFVVGGTLLEKRLKGFEVVFSFANAAPPETTVDDILLVRYFHDGRWRNAGEVYLNKELSNAVNSAFFSATLEDIDDWEDLSDVRIAIEFDRNNTHARAELYLDAAWIDAIYTERAQDILAEDEELSLDVPENITPTLAENDAESLTVLPDGSVAEFPYTDDIGDGLMMRVDKSSYGRSGDAVLVSIENTGDVAESVRLHAAFPKKAGSVRAISQLKRNVPQEGEAGVTYANAWIPLTVMEEEQLPESAADLIQAKYAAVAATADTIDILPGQHIYLKIEMESPGKGAMRFALFAEGESLIGDLDSRALREESLVRESSADTKAQAQVNDRLSGKADFDGDELPEFRLKFKTQRGKIVRGLRSLFGLETGYFVEGVQLRNASGEYERIPTEVVYGEGDEWTLRVTQQPRSFRPGKFEALFTVTEGSRTYTDSVEFYWGVLAANIEKSSYKRGEDVRILMAALDDAGDTLCDADLELSITDPSGVPYDVPVEGSGECGPNNVTDVADYSGTFRAEEIGTYQLILTHRDEDAILHRVFESFEVREASFFTIRRTGATRIYPVEPYRMTLDLNVTQDFVGEFIEAVPDDFVILDAGGAEIRMYGAAKRLVWPVDLRAGESLRVTYAYDAPDISPYVYLLGPAEVRAESGSPFTEPRAWKLASDATGNMLLFWDSTFIPTGWTCVSCLPSDPFYQRFIVGSSTPGVNGGSATHTHSATGAVSTSTGSQGVDTNTQATPTVGHTHTFTPTIGTGSNLPPYRHLSVIQYNSVGEPPSIPAGAIAIFDAAVPTGWTRYSAQDGRFIRSESTTTIATTGGSSTHTHAISGTTGAAAGTTNIRNPGTTVSVAADAHTHSVSSTTGSVSNEPPFIEVILGKINATSSPPNDMIAMWSGDPSVGWGTVSSTSEPFENRFLKASTTYSGVGGGESHTHTNVTGITSGAPSATINRDSTPAATNVASAAHTHAVSVTSFATSTHMPPYRTAVFAKREGGAPPAGPTLYDIPFDNEKTGSSTPYFEFSATDPDGSDILIYQIQWDDDADLDSSPIGDRTSDVESGCSPNCFENRTTPSDTSPFTEGERIRFSIQSSLVSGTTYYWRVRAKESESSTWGSWATTTSFTYIANTSPSLWFQTQDAQFDSNTQSGAETYGSHSARLAITVPTEALVTYGEGVVQTPRYRLWNGSAWGSEASAQSVGGTIQWMTAKAGTTRDEYVLATVDASNDVNVQVYNGTSDTWGNLVEVTTTLSSAARRGVDLAYETDSGDAMVVYCDGDADPAYRIWNGSSWSGATTINLASANNCEFIKLAADPRSDELILVARDTGTQYETMVWDGGAWGNARTIGSMSDVANEGIAVEYEESGDQAIVVVSNGVSNNFAWTSWNGSEWSINTTQGLGDDFEWGNLRRDVGSDAMALCYSDQDSDIGVVRWDGNAWITFSERDTGGNGSAGRPVDCAFETTAGRDGYIMIPYSDTTNARYQYWDGSAYSTEASISTIQDSWTVDAVRTGDGTVLALFNDDVNTQFDFSYWNGSSWSAIQTLETSPSVTVSPFMQPHAMVAQVYQPSTGSMTSTIIDFDVVPARPTWGEVLWTTTEPSGTDVKLQVMYENAGACSTLIPDGTLPGNSVGFDATTSPINISGISTSTYNRICLKASFSTSNQNPPSLDEWSVSWERQPYLTQSHFRWYANTASLTPTDPWPSGGNDIGEDIAIPTAYAPSPNEVLRLRLALLDSNVALSSSDLYLRLQYAEGATCSASLTWRDVGAVGSTTAAWRGYDNSTLTDGATVPSTVLSGSDAAETYEEVNDSSTNPNGVSVGNEGEWDWVLQHNASNATNYCFRAITAEGVSLNAYDRYPSLITNSRPDAPTQEKPFDNEAFASTTPWFEFVAEDPESDDMTYQVQIDDDFAFGSPLERDSQTHLNEFTNIITPSDKDPFTASQSVRFIPTSALSNGTTYYWRVRAKDRTKSNEWSNWSAISSFTVDTSVTMTTWRQTTAPQFDTDTLEDTESTGSNDVIISSGFTVGTTTSGLIDFDWKTSGNSWGSLSWNDNETAGDIKYHIEYLNGSTWELIPDADLAGNAAGYDTSSVSLLGVSPTIYNQIRIRANLTDSAGTPRLLDWTLAWGLAVEQPTTLALFDNEKTGTTTPNFRFHSTDPESQDLEYEISWSTTPDFTASTSRRSGAHGGFTDISSTTDSNPFASGDTVRFTIQSGDALTNGTTYWWRVRARDTAGANVWSVWSTLRSFTVDTAIDVSTWFQTTDEQFDTDTLNDIETTGSDSVQITSVIRESFFAYAEGTAQVPRYRFWNGSTWGSELSALSIGDVIRFVEAAAAPTRDEYIIATMGSTGVVDAQVINGATDTAGNSTEIVAVAPDTTQRGFDIAYETDSGDAMVAACNGTEATYKIWNGSSWSSSNAITLSVSANCEWLKLAADPTSDEIVLVVRDATTGATDYETLVWNGSSWGNSLTMGSQVTAANEGIAVSYEESGNQAVVAVSNGTNNNFIWSAWNGSSWSTATVTAIGGDFEGGNMTRDEGSDAMAFCYVDVDSDIGYVLWDGSSWGTFSEFETLGNSTNGRPISCEYETSAGRDGNVMMPYSDTAQAEYVFWNGSVLSGASVLTTISDSTEIRTVRTGDDLILAVAYDDANTEYDFIYWNGSTWSTEQVLETTSITSITPRTVPLDIVARIYPSFTVGSVYSSAIDFDDGSGLKWDFMSWNETTPGTSNIAMQVQYLTASSTWALIPDADLPGNSSGFTSSPIDLGGLSYVTYNTLRGVANLTCSAGDCPILLDWTLAWSPGLEISGTAKQYDRSTNVTSGTVAVAVNDAIQVGKTGTISGGTWSIPNVTVFPGDVVTVFVSGAADQNEAVAVSVYDGIGDMAGLELVERYLSLGSSDNPTITNANIAQYDNSVSGSEDIFSDVDAGNDLSACAIAGCSDVRLLVKSGTTFRPDSTSSGNVATHDVVIDGTFTADNNALTVSGSWDTNGTFTPGGSTVTFTATSSTETIDGTGAAAHSFNAMTLGSGSGSATWQLASAFDVNGNLTVNFGTLSPLSQNITLAGNLSIGASGLYAKGSGSLTFDGTGSSTWSDSTSSKQDMGTLIVNGSAKTITLGSAVKASDITIGADDTLSASGSSFSIEVLGNWTNNNVFNAQNGTVTFAATTTGKTIAPGNSSFYNITFNGAGGNWAFSASVSASNNFTIQNGVVTLPLATTTVAGNFDVSGGSFMHNNGVVALTAASGKTIRPSTSSFYDLTFNGTGSWSFLDANATTSRHTTITAGSVTLPTTLAVGGSFLRNGGSFTHNSGTLRFTTSGVQSIRLGTSDAYNLTFTGSGSWSFADTNATTTNAVTILNGTTTLPSGVFAVGGSWNVSGGSFAHNNGTVKFNSADTGESIQPGGSWFNNLSFDNTGGGWTIAQHATSSGATSLLRASSFTLSSGQSLAVGGTFTNSVGATTTTWTGSTLFLYSSTTYAVNTKSAAGDAYENLVVGANTDVRMWNSSAVSTSVDSSGSLYSQDHAAIDGDLYVWGSYVNTGNEYWSYATDFDGTALGGSSRQVDVRFAPGASFTFATGTLQIVGTTLSTTTIANQGSGSYGLTITGGSVNAQYYSVRDTNTSGVSLSGTPTILSLADGDFELTTNGGSMLTVAGSVIDQNPALQIQRVRFATSTGISSGTNVTATGSPSSYWWFRNHSGNYASENFDVDPGGNPGNVRWDDSGFNITVAGVVYADHGSTSLGSPTCDGSTPVVTIVVNGLTTYSGSCNASTGAYSIANVQFSGDAVIAAYLNTNGGVRAVSVTKTPTADITDFDLYQNALIVRHESTAPMTIANLALFDEDNDTDVFLSATSSSLTVRAGHELHVWDGKTFAPGGAVTLEGGGAGESDGRFHLGSSATFTAGNDTHAIGGAFRAESGATFTAASSTLLFTATTSTSIYAAQPLTLYNLTFNGSGGTWSLNSPANATTTIQNAFTVTSGTLAGGGDLIVQSGTMSGDGAIAMTGGTVQVQGTGNFGGNTNWQFHTLVLGDATSTRTTTKSGSGTTIVRNVLTLATNHTLNAGSATWELRGGGTPLVTNGIFNAQTAPFAYTATSSTNVADETYAQLTLAPSSSGSPTYTILGGTLTAEDLILGDGTNPVTVTFNTNDPSVVVLDDVSINANATLVASNVGAFEIGGSWTNGGTFTHSGGTVLFDSTDTGETIQPGSSPFAVVTFDGAGGGWTITNSATTTGTLSIQSGASFTLSSGATLSVGGSFTNAVGGSATTWTDSTLSLVSGTAFAINSASAGGDTYGTLSIGANTDVRMWNSQASTTAVNTSGSLYSQDHAATDGDLYIWGEYVQSSGSEYWSYATDFDGTSLGTSSRQVDVRIASSSSVTLSGGILDVLGASGASTTIRVQGSGAYAFDVTGGTFNANYYEFRNLDADGLTLSGSPTITSLSRGDFELAINGGTTMTVAGSVIDANPLKILTNNRFATSSGSAGVNVKATGSSISSWKFNLHHGGLGGESFDDDPAGDPGYLRWDDSASDIIVAGNVYSDEGSTVSSVCDGSTPVVRLMVQGGGSHTASCNASTGAYSIPSIFFNPGDVLTLYLDSNGGQRAVNVSVDPNTNIANMHLYENRVIVRHEDTAPITIADLAIYDSDEDSDIPFDATDAASDTLILPPETKLIVWNSKTFAPAGDVTMQSGGSGAAWDGTLHLLSGAIFSAAGTQTHSIGGYLTVDSGANIQSANSTFIFTATTTGKTITPGNSSFYNITFNGSGGNWAFAGGSATSTNDFTIQNGTVTLPSATTTIGGSFTNSGGTFMHNNGHIVLTSGTTGKTLRAGGSNLYNVTFNGTGGGWTMPDTNATSSRNFIITAGSVTLPAGTLAVGGSFTNAGTFTHNNGTIKLTSTLAGNALQGGSSNFNNLLLNGSGGEWLWGDASAQVNDFTITAGSTTLPAALTVRGSLVNAGTFNHGGGIVTFAASTTGKTVTPGESSFYDVAFDGTGGGWTLTGNATSTRNFALTNASSFTLSSGATLSVGGAFSNGVGGGATTWTGSTLRLSSGTSFAINSKTAGGDAYETLIVATSTDVRMWNSSATTTSVDASGSLYSQDHAAIDGDLSIWGEFMITSGSEHWSYATDFDGTALGGSSRQVDVRIASGSAITLSGGTLGILGTGSATTTIRVQGSGAYAFDVSGGTLNANYYELRNLDMDGLNLSGTPAITSLSSGDFELSLSGGTMLTVTASVIDANASKQIANVRFATSSGVTSGYNVVRSGTPVSAWNFQDHSGNYDGESFDNDGGDACGSIRWDDSACLFVSQSHYRWRNDDGGEGAPDSEWYNASWSKRKRVTIVNETAETQTNLETKIVVAYDSDMQSDFDDLRFTDASGTTSIDYWIEEVDAGVSATVWVEVPSLPASDAATVYMYYGNGSVLTSGDGSAVFRFFDDFEDDNISEYSGNTSLFNVGTAFNHNGTYGLDAAGNEDQKTTNGIYRTGTLMAQGDTIRFFQYVDATQDDEPCTLFAVQGSGQNYAVCLDQYPTEQVVIAENVTSNDGSGTALASTSVTYANGWYEVEIDWLTTNAINVTVYDDAGATFASVNTSDSSYTQGGMGFAYWFQNGGWDFYSVRPRLTDEPTYSFGAEQGSGGATWKKAEDTFLDSLGSSENVRLRFAIENSGSEINSQEFRLQVAAKGSALSCEAVPYINYNDVPTASGGCGSSPICMATSSQFVNQTNTTGLLSSSPSMSFTPGTIVEDPSNETSSLTVGSNQVTEVEYNFQLTSSATESAYCLRTSNGGLDLDNYDRVAELRLSFPPTITNFALNNGFDIALTEGATTTVMATGTVTDLNGYADIAFATSTIYRSSAGATCSADANSCYQLSSPSCALSGCSGNSCTLTCSASMEYIADPTDSGSYEADTWLAVVAVEDDSGLRDTETSFGVELLSLFGLRVDSDIDFGSLEVGSNTGATNATTTVINTGNTNIDIQLEGTDLAGADGSIPVGEQKYATTTFAYSACAICSLLTGSATNVEVDLPKPTSTSSPVETDVYWGINIPIGTSAEEHQGTNTFWAVAE